MIALKSVCAQLIVLFSINYLSLAHPLKNVFAVGNIVDTSDGSSEGVSGILTKIIPKKESPSQSLSHQYAVDEYESLKSKKKSIYDNSQNKFSAFKNAEPIVDNLNEEDKYGNSGDKFQSVGRFLVNGMEGLSNLINKIFETPKQVTRQISGKITDKLNNVGAKLVGLA